MNDWKQNLTNAQIELIEEKAAKYEVSAEQMYRFLSIANAHCIGCEYSMNCTFQCS